MLVAQTFLLALPTGGAWALPADNADDICSPSADPCIIDHVYNVTGPLDFGLRSVIIQGPGRLFGEPDIILSAGKLDISIGNANAIDTSSGGAVEVTIYRACSGDGTTRCLDDTECVGLGTCSAGNTGTLFADGQFNGAGPEPVGGTILAAGDITLLKRAYFAANLAGITGPEVSIESTMGSVTADLVSARSGEGSMYYDVGYGGTISIRAAVDIEITGKIDAWGAASGGSIDINAGRDIFMTSQITNNAGLGIVASGGTVILNAGRDLVIGPGESGDEFQEINSDGGGGFYRYGYGYGGVPASGYGGYQFFTAGEDLTVAETGRVHSRGGAGAYGGKIYFYSLDGTTTIDGDVRASSPGPFYSIEFTSAGGYINVYADEGLTLGPKSLLETASVARGGYVNLFADGPVTLDGEIDVRGTGILTEYTYPGGGNFKLVGAADVTVGGRIRNGARGYGSGIEFDVCRLTLTGTGVIDHSFGQPNPENGYTELTIHESMTAEPGSKLLADSVGGRTSITYRDFFKPPVLNGTMNPAPLLDTDPSLSGCPVCGNLEIDEGETCDDGNFTNGDNCRSDCQDEGCLAQSPGFPSTPMCDDGDDCTLDHCNATTHSCTNVISCEEGVQCTVDACAMGACQHTPDDSLCDDGEECTDDLCNPTSGCAHANLTATACDDSDFCTVTESCNNGHCVPIGAAFTQDNKVQLTFRTGPADDRMKATLNLPLASFTANPTVTGMKLVVADVDGVHVYDADMPAAEWEDSNGSGQKYRFRDPSGINSAQIKKNDAKGVAKAIIKMSGAEIPGAAGEPYISVSLLFGVDPGTDECLTARLVPCTVSATKSKCSDPKE
jgi:hypothetical protein